MRSRSYVSPSSDPPTYKIGDEVDMWYDPDHPERCGIRGESTSFTIACALAGLLFFAVGSVSSCWRDPNDFKPT